MSNDPREVHVQVFIHPGDPMGDYHFETSDLPMGKDNFLYFHNCDHNGLDVYYDIQPGTNYVFPEKKGNWKNEAVWATSQQGCPTSEPKPNWGTFQAKDIQNSGKTLVVYNVNNKKETFWYTLRVTNDGGTNYLPLDPGGGNENGSFRNWASLSIAVVGGVVTGSLLTLGVQTLMGS